MSEQLDQVILDTEGIRKFAYGDRLIIATIEDELDFVVKNNPEQFLDKIDRNHRSRGAILSCIGERGVITQFHADRVEGFAEDNLAFKIREAIRHFNPENDCVIVHIGRDAQSCLGIFSIESLHQYKLERLLKFGIQNLTIHTID